MASLEGMTDEQNYEMIKKMLITLPRMYLQMLHEVLSQLLSFDLISQLPVEAARHVFSYLNASSLSAAAACCQKWMQIANTTDKLWYCLCKYNNFIGLSTLPQQSLLPKSSPASLNHNISASCPLVASQTCQWREVYKRAFTLKQNWKKGRYSLSPLLRGHSKPVTTITCEGDILVSGSADNAARIWSLKSCKCLNVLEGHTDSINEVVLKDGVIVTACTDGLVRVYDVKSGHCTRSLHGHTGSVEHVAFNGRVIVSGGSDSLVKVWDSHSGKLQHTLSGHTEEIECIWLNEAGNLAVSGSWDSTLRVWDVGSGLCKHLLMSHTEVVYCCVCVCSDGKVVSGGGDNLLKIWDLETGHVINTLSGHKQEVLCIQCSSDIIASASADSSVRLWNYVGLCLHVLEGHIGVVRCLAMKEDILVSGGDRKRLIVWDIKSGKELHTVYRQQTLLHQMCVTDTQIITASPDSPGTISIVNYW